MKELLPGQELAEGRYVVTKTVTFGEKGGVYVAKRTSDSTRWALKEIIPSPSLTDDRLASRTEQMNNAMEVLGSFDHPGLSKMVDHFVEGRRHYVVLEMVDGITLKTLLEMSVKGQPEQQVLEWAMELADALHYLHNRPRPFVFDALDPSNIMVTTEGKLKLINYGLDRFMDEEDVPEFSTAGEVLTSDIRKFGETIYFCLCRKEPGPFGVTQSDPISPEAAKVINRCLSAEDKGVYVSFEELKKQFDRVLHPPEQAPVVRSKISFAFARWARWSVSWGRLWQEALWKFLQQPIWLVVLEIVLLLTGLWYLNRALNPPILARTEPAAYVGCGNKIWVISKRSKELITRIPIPSDSGKIQAIVATPDNTKVIAATEKHIFLINSKTNQVVGQIPSDKDPSELLMDPTGRYLFVLHSSLGHAALVQLDPVALPPNRETRVKRKDTIVGLFPASRGAEGLAVEFPPKPTPGLEDVPVKEPSMKVYISSLEGNSVFAYTAMPPLLSARRMASGPGALALVEDNKKLVVALRKDAQLIGFRTRGMAQEAKSGMDTGGNGPIQFLQTTGGFWCLNKSGTLALINPATLSLISKVELRGQATSGVVVKSGDREEIWVALDRGEVVIVSATGGAIAKRFPVGVGASTIWMVE